MKKHLPIIITLTGIVFFSGCGPASVGPEPINPSQSVFPSSEVSPSSTPKETDNGDVTAEPLPAETTDASIDTNENADVTTGPLPAETTDASIDTNEYEEILAQLNSYQDRYFEICEKGKLFDSGEDGSYDIKKSDLFAEVISKIPQDNIYLKQYNEIEIEMSDINYFKPDGAGDNFHPNTITVYYIAYTRFNNYLNDLYADIKNKIPEEAFNELEKDESQWVTDKENYLKSTVFKGNEAYPQTGAFKLDAIKFRCLLLILYLS